MLRLVSTLTLTFTLVAAPPGAAAASDVVEAGTRAGLRGLSVVGERLIWIGGTGGTLRRSSDGGATWADVAPPDSQGLDFRDVATLGARHVVALTAGPGAASRLFVTRDAGRTWTTAWATTDERAFLDGVAFWDARRGLAFGDPVDGRLMLLLTRDGGRTWSAAARPPEMAPDEAAFAASGTSVAVHGRRRAWIGTGGSRARVLRTSDGGATWSAAVTPLRHATPSAGVFSVVFWSALDGVAVGGDYKQPADATGSAAFTRDGGRTWTPAEKLPGGFRSAVARVGSGTRPRLIAVGTNGADVSDDGGRTWTPLPALGAPLNALVATASGRLWAVGPEGLVRRLER